MSAAELERSDFCIFFSSAHFHDTLVKSPISDALLIHVPTIMFIYMYNPYVHVHVIPRTNGDGGKTLMAMWPNNVARDIDHTALANLASELSEV